MLKKVYLTSRVPEKGAGLAIYKEGNWPDDIKQKLIAHENEKKQMVNIPPNLKMMPLAKYQTVKWAKTVSRMDEGTPVGGKVKQPPATQAKQQLPEWAYADLKNLPAYAQARARKIMPLLHEHHPDEEGFYELLYDLSTNSQQLKSDPETLEAAVTHLENSNVPAHVYVNKLAPKEAKAIKLKTSPHKGWK